MFHETRYNLAFCRYRMALSKRQTEKTDLLKRAETDIRVVYRQFPNMGKGMFLESSGKDWHDKYDALLKTIQKLLGKQADGLKGLATRRKTIR